MEQRALYSVYSLKLAKYLFKLGFELIATKQMEEAPAKTIFRFEDTEEIRKAVDDYTKACEKYFGR